MTREEAIKELQESHDMMRNYDIDDNESRLMTALNMAIKVFEQEPCEDCIDRADAMTEIMMFAGNNKHGDDIYIKVSDVIELLRELPSVTPQEPKTGHWVRDTITDLYHCSCCRYICRQDPKNKDDYCPNCGARMSEG